MPLAAHCLACNAEDVPLSTLLSTDSGSSGTPHDTLPQLLTFLPTAVSIAFENP